MFWDFVPKAIPFLASWLLPKVQTQRKRALYGLWFSYSQGLMSCFISWTTPTTKKVLRQWRRGQPDRQPFLQGHSQASSTTSLAVVPRKGWEVVQCWSIHTLKWKHGRNKLHEDEIDVCCRPSNWKNDIYFQWRLPERTVNPWSQQPYKVQVQFCLLQSIGRTCLFCSWEILKHPTPDGLASQSVPALDILGFHTCGRHPGNMDRAMAEGLWFP